jgi:hypothetical protein
VAVDEGVDDAHRPPTDRAKLERERQGSALIAQFAIRGQWIFWLTTGRPSALPSIPPAWSTMPAGLDASLALIDSSFSLMML